MPNPDQPTAPNEHCSHAGEHDETRNRTFSLNSPQFHASFARNRAWIPNGALPPEPHWPREETHVSVAADDGEAAGDAFGAWLRHLQAGRIGAAK
ncbi:MAG: hypothetical protein ABIQ32_09545 [Sphingomicrobium sp.]